MQRNQQIFWQKGFTKRCITACKWLYNDIPHAPNAKTALLCATLGYLAAYYFALPLYLGWSIITIFCCLFSGYLGFTSKFWLWLFRAFMYLLCILVGAMGGKATRDRAEMQYEYSSLGMESENIQIYFGRVEQDAVPHKEGGFRFIVQLFASSDGKDLLTSAGGRVFVRAKPENPMPGLYELVAVHAPIKSFLSDRDGQVGRRILFSRAPAQSIEIFHKSDLDFASLNKSNPFALKAVAYQMAYGKSNIRQTTKAKPGNLKIYKYLTDQNIDNFKALTAKKNFAVWETRSRMRSKLFASLQNLFPASGRDLFQALLLGASEELPEWVKENFRRSGAMHILALSGFHVGILAGIVGFLLRRPLGQSRSLVCSSLILFFYLWLVGPLPSLTRAVLMFLLLNACKFFLRRADGLCILALSALLQTLIFPASALRLSFQLSYAALLGIICFGGRCNTLALMAHARILQGFHKVTLQKFCQPVFLSVLQPISLALRLAMQGMGVTLAVLLCSSPILIARFGQLQWIGIFASLVETPIITLYMWLSLCFWPIAWLLQITGQGAILTLLQNLYTQWYWATLAPMEFFARVDPWIFTEPENAEILIKPLMIYVLLFLAIITILYRYELRWVIRQLRTK